MNETNTKPVEGAQVNPTPQEGDKTFNQEDVNRIVGERLAREKEKANADLEAREKEIAQREFRLKAKETLSERNFPADLLDAMNCSDEVAFNKSLEILSRYVDTPRASKMTVDSGAEHGGSGSSDSIRRAMGL